VGQAGVRSNRTIHAELDAFVGGCGADVGDDLGGSFGAAELLRVRLGDRRRNAGGRPRIELIRLVFDGDSDRTVEFGNGLFESPFADVTPRADHIGPDLDMQLSLRWSLGFGREFGLEICLEIGLKIGLKIRRHRGNDIEVRHVESDPTRRPRIVVDVPNE
jgi:hypothetical protein